MTGQDWVPAFPSQRPPWAPGNTVAEVHGAYSERRLAPIAGAILADVLADPACSYLRAPRFAAELQAWAAAEARVRLLEAHIVKYAEEVGDESGVGDLADERTRAAWSLLHRCEARAMSGRDRLGLSPAAAARLGRDIAQGRQADAAVELTRMREEHERALRELKGEVDD